jgi:hypothetical protein
MVRAKGSAGEGGISHGAQVETAGDPISPISIASPRKPHQRLGIPQFDPTGARPCATCGRKDRWFRPTWLRPVGGFMCCPPATLVAEHAALAHACGPVCVLGVPA